MRDGELPGVFQSEHAALSWTNEHVAMDTGPHADESRGMTCTRDAK